jgi:hypothetical protein
MYLIMGNLSVLMGPLQLRGTLAHEGNLLDRHIRAKLGHLLDPAWPQ